MGNTKQVIVILIILKDLKGLYAKLQMTRPAAISRVEGPIYNSTLKLLPDQRRVGLFLINLQQHLLANCFILKRY